MTQPKNSLPDRIISFIKSDQSSQEDLEVAFNQLTCDIFAYQFAKNQPYRLLAQQQRRTPMTIKHWQDVPRMPIQAFKQMTLSTEDISQSADIFYSSGTTDPVHKSQHYLSRLDVWETAMKQGFKQYVMGKRQKITILSLFPDQVANPHSSLSRYINTAIATFGTPDSQVLFRDGAIAMAALKGALDHARTTHQPVLLIGASFSYVHLLDALATSDQRYPLPEGSIVFDTGGFKGQARTISMTTLYTQLSEFFNVPRAHIINMFGMTEISSQCYDGNLLLDNDEQPFTFDKVVPAWVRIQILDATDLKPATKGEPGILAYYDLANWDTCLAILTEDLAVETDVGFQLIGRVNGAAARGCSIAVDELMKSQALGERS
ncbi:acyl-CoA synthetase [Leuconostoc holzapfelii]|uniref:Acyl-CoA synthetase n=1 Tax=Leuconostoc holzapfelii TaxID=434464 RepID=A0ABT2NWR9_9LACO|nr:acyl-CoA synthetase [Leuconostoc holzapfelii]MCT8389810.1 acyl-CoA synthetase [Leuconostoc holzapfelii]